MEQNHSENIYLNGRKEWNERYGDFMLQAARWRVVAFSSLGIAAAATLGLIYIGMQSKIMPVVVAVDDLGHMALVGMPSEKAPRDTVLQAAVSEWILWHRTVTSDASVNENYMYRVYAYLKMGSTAKGTIDEWYKTEQNNPFQKMEKGTVTVDVQSVLRMTPKTFQVDWGETSRNKGGQNVGVTKFRSLVEVEELDVNPKTALWNPLGLYIKSVAIQQL